MSEALLWPGQLGLWQSHAPVVETGDAGLLATAREHQKARQEAAADERLLPLAADLQGHE